MDRMAALRLAIDLWQVPSRVRAGRASPLPDGISLLLRLANKDDDAGLACAEATGRDPDFLRDAATFYIEQILLAPDSDSYRVLGLTPAASPAELRSCVYIYAGTYPPRLPLPGAQAPQLL